MGVHFQPPVVDDALAQIESDILPSFGRMLEGVLEAAAMARAGVEADEHGGELRRVVRELEQVTARMELIAASQRPLQPAEFRISP